MKQYNIKINEGTEVRYHIHTYITYAEGSSETQFPTLKAVMTETWQPVTIYRFPLRRLPYSYSVGLDSSGSIPGRAREFSLLQKCRPPLGPTMGTRGPSSGNKRQGREAQR
jgi:hypothetical protein